MNGRRALDRRIVRNWLLPLSLLGLLGCDKTSAGSPEDAASGAIAKEQPAEVALPGIDPSALTPRERREWGSYVREFISPCPDVPVPIAQCVLEKRACPKCATAAKFILKAVQAGAGREQIERGYKNRFDPAAIKDVPIDGSPTTGPDSAPVTIVEFADFECPYCQGMVEVLDKAAAERKGKIRLVYKVKLVGHAHGEIAAKAALAAREQGKFWEMHHKLFSNLTAHEQRDFDKYAKELGLDVAKFAADMKSEKVTSQIQRDQKLAEALNIDHTPTIYINGRDFDPQNDINEWLAQELGEVSKPGASPVLAPAPNSRANALGTSASASASAGASASPIATAAPAGSASAKPAASANPPQKGK